MPRGEPRRGRWCAQTSDSTTQSAPHLLRGCEPCTHLPLTFVTWLLLIQTMSSSKTRLSLQDEPTQFLLAQCLDQVECLLIKFMLKLVRELWIHKYEYTNIRHSICTSVYDSTTITTTVQFFPFLSIIFLLLAAELQMSQISISLLKQQEAANNYHPQTCVNVFGNWIHGF